jgi:hypothetical protein
VCICVDRIQECGLNFVWVAGDGAPPGRRQTVEGNPAENISDIRRCQRVMKNGVLCKSAEVYGAIGIKPD